MNDSRFIQLGSINDLVKLDPELLRAAMLANARFASNGELGRTQGDSVFEEVTERRQRWRGYSGCGDLIHWCLRRLGLRDERILNREDDDGTVPWRIGRNVSLLVFATGRAFRWWRRGEAFDVSPGDMLLIGEYGLEHVFIVESLRDGVVRSFDYGQVFSGKHGGRAARS